MISKEKDIAIARVTISAITGMGFLVTVVEPLKKEGSARYSVYLLAIVSQ